MTLRGWITTPTYRHGERGRRKRSTHFAYEPTSSEEQVQSGAQREEGLRDKHAGSRMDDDGCPNDGGTSSGETSGENS